MAHILFVGKDEALLQTRKLILERAGHEVTQAFDLREVLTACKSTLEQFWEEAATNLLLRNI